MLIWTIVSSWKFSRSVVVSWLFLRGSAEITGSSSMRSGRFAEWSHKWKHPRIHQHSLDRRDSTRSHDAFLLAEPCRFISVFRCWYFFYISIHFYTECFIFRVAFVRGFHPMVCLGSTEGWRSMRRSGLGTLWWYFFASIAPTERLNMRILVLLEVFFLFQPS